jgi:hypothetical protein
MAKIPVKSVWLNRAEGPIRETGARTVDSLSAADAQLKRWAHSAPKKGGGYDKTDFRIEWADGETYEGRYDLQREDEGKSNLLGSHVQHYLNFHAGLFCPEHMSREDYENYLKRVGADETQRAATLAFLQNYEL